MQFHDITSTYLLKPPFRAPLSVAYATDCARPAMRNCPFTIRKKRLSELDRSRKHALECLRLEADCTRLATETGHPELQAHFYRMAKVWADLGGGGKPGNKTGTLH